MEQGENQDQTFERIGAMVAAGQARVTQRVLNGITAQGEIVRFGSREEMRMAIFLQKVVAVTVQRAVIDTASVPVSRPSPIRLPPTPGDLLAAYDHAITAKELAPVLGLSQQMVFSRAAAGSLPCFHIGGAVKFCPATILTTLGLATTYTVVPLTIVDRLAGFGRAMNADEVAYILGVTAKTIYRQAEAGNLPSFPIGTRLVFYQATMARYIASISGGGAK